MIISSKLAAKKVINEKENVMKRIFCCLLGLFIVFTVSSLTTIAGEVDVDLSLLSPSGGEVEMGKPHTVRFLSNGTVSHARIEVSYDAGENWDPIYPVIRVEPYTSFRWNVPTIPGQAIIRVRDLCGTAVVTGAPFTITKGPGVTIVSGLGPDFMYAPSGGD